jgi:dienelactone hydrolase
MRAMRVHTLLTAALSLFATSALAKVHGETVEYSEGGTALEGYLAWDDADKEARPGVVVVHDWMGLSADTRKRADMLAAEGYVAFAADIYGKGVRPRTASEAGAQASKWKSDRAALRRRVRAAYDQLLKSPHVAAGKIAAIGYCFGGTTALELARSGTPLAATVSFHGGLGTPTPGDAKNIKGKVLALHGGDDPHVPPAEVEAFEKEMREGGVDWQFVAYGGAVHAFTVVAAGSDASRGAAYNERADRRSWAEMQRLFAEVFGPPRRDGK